MRRIIRESAPLRRLYYRAKLAHATGQSDEGKILERLSSGIPRTFIEIGFHPIEFNCVAFARHPEWRGLLIDGNERQVSDARYLFSERVDIVQKFLTLETLGPVREHFRELGILSIDVDGNDYWFLKELIDCKPNVICIEYNSSFGLEPVTIPYDASFNRHNVHPRGWYHGASLTALAKLCAHAGYGLTAISENGTNAFFSRDGKLNPEAAWKPNMARARMSGIDHAAQWNSLKTLPLIPV